MAPPSWTAIPYTPELLILDAGPQNVKITSQRTSRNRDGNGQRSPAGGVEVRVLCVENIGRRHFAADDPGKGARALSAGRKENELIQGKAAEVLVDIADGDILN